MMWPSYSRRTFWALIVMPRSRSMSIELRYWARMSRASTAPVYSRMRSARVDFPWSMWAITLMLRMASGRVIACTLTCWLSPPELRSSYTHGQHQESEEAQPAERPPPRAQQGRAVGAEDAPQERRQVRSRGRRGHGRPRAAGGQGARHGRRQGDHPQEPGGQPQGEADAPGGQGDGLHLGLAFRGFARAGPGSPPGPALASPCVSVRWYSGPGDAVPG